MKILFIIAVYHVHDTMTQSPVHTAGICLFFSLFLLILLFFSFHRLYNSFLPFLFFSPLLWYNITHSSNHNFYLGTTHLKKKIISNFMLLEKPLSLKQIFHYYYQFKSQIKWQREREIEVIWMLQSTYKFFSSLFFLLLVCSCFFFLLLSIPAFFFAHFVDIVLRCLRLPFTVTRFVLSPWRTRLAQAPNRIMLYTPVLYHNDTIIKQTQ